MFKVLIDYFREALRDMPQCLTIKRHIKSKLMKSVSQKSRGRPLSWYKRMKYRNSIVFAQVIIVEISMFIKSIDLSFDTRSKVLF